MHIVEPMRRGELDKRPQGLGEIATPLGWQGTDASLVVVLGEPLSQLDVLVEKPPVRRLSEMSWKFE